MKLTEQITDLEEVLVPLIAKGWVVKHAEAVYDEVDGEVLHLSLRYEPPQPTNVL